MLVYAVLLLGCLAPVTASAQTDSDPITQTELITSSAMLAPGESGWLGLRMRFRDDWHSYWQNPGDSGIPTTIAWDAPSYVTIGPIHWPVPERVDFSGLVNFGYHHEVILLAPISVAEDAPKEAFTVHAKANWLVCKDICIPEGSEHRIELNAPHASSSAKDSADIQTTLKQLPAPYKGEMHFQYNDRTVEAVIALPDTKRIRSAHFYPITPGIIENAPLPMWEQYDGALHFTLQRGSGTMGETMQAVVHATFADGSVFIWHVALPHQSAPLPTADKAGASLTFIQAIIMALIGGLILNAMPCVLPILALKVLAISKKAEHAPAAVRIQGLAYTLGVLVSFAALAAILIAIQQAGTAVGWGFQLQSPVFVAVLVYILFLVGLNLSGAFTLPSLMGNVGNRITQQDNLVGSFMTGVLAAIVATPCTAPFMAPAIGVALAQPPVLALLIFLSLGLGLALPYLLISFVPALRGWLPKPGAWMERFKQLLAFPMYAAAAWLLWVLSLQAGDLALAWALAGLIFIGFIVWWIVATQSRFTVLLLILALFAGLTFSVLQLPNEPAARSATADAMYEPFSMDTLEQYRAEGKPVFVNATAAWCITCKVNERVALNRESTQQIFDAMGVTLLKADWTSQDEEITTFLASFERNGVPLYVYYPADGGSPQVLPQLLTPEIVREALQNKS